MKQTQLLLLYLQLKENICERVSDTMADIQDVVCLETFLPVLQMSSFEVIL